MYIKFSTHDQNKHTNLTNALFRILANVKEEEIRELKGTMNIRAMVEEEKSREEKLRANNAFQHILVPETQQANTVSIVIRTLAIIVIEEILKKIGDGDRIDKGMVRIV